MKKILFLLLSTVAMYGQVPADATPLENIQITNNTTDNSATKVNVQSTDGTINTISKSDLVNVVEVNDVPSLPLTGVADKIYVVKNVNKIYRWNGTFYQELAGSDISGLQAQIDLKANNSDVIHKTGDEIISLGTKTFNISQPIVGAQFNISATANGASAIAIKNMNNGNAFYVDNKGGTAITVGLKNNSRGILISDYSGGGQTNELFTAVKDSNIVYQLNSEGQVLGKSFVKLSAPTTNILLAGGGDIAQNTAFNKNFGTTAGTVAQGNDSRINNGQTAFSWGNHAGIYQPLENQRLSKTDSPSFANITLNNEVGNSVFTQYKIGGNNRFIIGLDGIAESGINIGSNYALYRYNNDGSYLGNVFSINRSTGIFNFSEVNPTILGNPIVSNNGGTWGINISGSSSNSTLWNGYDISVAPTDVAPSGILGFYNSGVTFQRSSATAVSSFLGLGSNAYSSTAYLPLSGGTLTGTLTAASYTATSLPVFENNAAASSLAVGQFYRTSTGVLMVKF